uniref:Uncharacterized protein n=1 Tax=Strongyloides papillosus TaxID=174720 RepID=A0A0N5C8C5_STREA
MTITNIQHSIYTNIYKQSRTLNISTVNFEPYSFNKIHLNMYILRYSSLTIFTKNRQTIKESINKIFFCRFSQIEVRSLNEEF